MAFMKKYFLLFFLISGSAFSKRPVWLSSPLDFCGKKYLCAVGEAAGKLMASANARNELAKIFKVKISGNKKIFTESLSKRLADGSLSGEVLEEIQGNISESAEEILEGVEIREVYQDDESHFALASLNKKKAADQIKKKIKKIDNEIYRQVKLGKRSNLFRSLKKWYTRDELNNRYEFLVERSIKPRVSLKKILDKKREKELLNTRIFLKVKEFDKKGEIKHILIQSLLENNFRIVSNKKNKYKYMVKVTLDSKKVYFNVKGFEKYKFTLKLSSKSGKGVSLGALSFISSKNGRNKQQCFERALPEIKKYLSDNLFELKLD